MPEVPEFDAGLVSWEGDHGSVRASALGAAIGAGVEGPPSTGPLRPGDIGDDPPEGLRLRFTGAGAPVLFRVVSTTYDGWDVYAWEMASEGVPPLGLTVFND